MPKILSKVPSTERASASVHTRRPERALSATATATTAATVAATAPAPQRHGTHRKGIPGLACLPVELAQAAERTRRLRRNANPLARRASGMGQATDADDAADVGVQDTQGETALDDKLREIEATQAGRFSGAFPPS